ncbi:MAG: ABC transporter permease [Proteobacteria bacterium]|nr:ABC transporter permease [Pseudomonadota bacterium]
MLAIAIVAIGVLGPLLVGDPLARDLDGGLTALGAPRGPGVAGLLGTDDLGRDVLARVIGGAGTSLAIAGAATAIALVLGGIVGLTAGHAGGRVDRVLMRGVDLVLAFPALLLAILLAALLRESALARSSVPVALTLGLVGWTTTARVLRDAARTLARAEHVVAARALGASPGRIVVRHVLPNVAGVLVVLTALGFAQNLLAESALSFVGLGPPPPAPTWGRMLFEGRAYYRTAPHLIVAPGLAILLSVVAFHLLAEGVRARAAGPR